MQSQLKKIERLIRDLIKEERYQKNSEEKLKNFIKSVLKEAEVANSNQVVNYIDICGNKKSIKVDSSEQYNEFWTTNFESKPNKLIFDKTKNLYVTNWVAYGLPTNPNEDQIKQIRIKNNCKIPKTYSAAEIDAQMKKYNPLKGTPEPMKGVTVDNTAVGNILGRNYAVGNEETVEWLHANRSLSPEEMRKRDQFMLGMVAFALPFAPFLAGSAATAVMVNATAYIASGLYTINAIEKAKDGDYEGAALDVIWSILGLKFPEGILTAGFKYFSKLGKNGIKNLRNKLDTNQPLTNLEYMAMKELNDNPEVVGKLVQDVLKKDGIPMGNVNPINAAKNAFKK